MTTPNPGRIALLDTFRFTTVTLALLQHASQSVGVGWAGSEAGLVWTVVTRGGTPALLIVFGMMLELAYARKLAQGWTVVIPRMLYRAVLCGLAAILSLALAALAGRYNLGSILATYVFLLVIGIGVIGLRRRAGFVGLLLLVALIWLLDRLYLDATSPWPHPLAHLGGALLGWGNAFGPSALHGLTLVVLGMALAAAVFAEEASGQALAALTAMLLVSAAVLLVDVAAEGPRALAVGLADFSAYRSGNAPAYYAFGACVAMALMGAAVLLHATAPPRAGRLFGRLGSATLPYFVIGNTILLLPSFEADGPATIAFFLAAHLAASWLCTLAWLAHARRSRGLARAEAWTRAQLEAWTVRAAMLARAHPSGKTSSV